MLSVVRGISPRDETEALLASQMAAIHNATMMAGRDSGTLFIPEVGDEVLVAFVQGDIRAPCVLGAVWNKTTRPPTVGDPAANVMLIRSRNGSTLRIVDDSDNNNLTVETPGGQRMTLQDDPGTVRIEDAHGNSVTLSPSGVKVLAASMVEVSAGTVEVSAGSLTVHAGLSTFDGVVPRTGQTKGSGLRNYHLPHTSQYWASRTACQKSRPVR
jgi:uncharacterized protein involved in type VI secretion and phage assembly